MNAEAIFIKPLAILFETEGLNAITNNFLVFFATQGNGRLTTETGNFPVNTNKLFLIQPLQKFSLCCTKIEGWCLVVKPGFLREFKKLHPEASDLRFFDKAEKPYVEISWRMKIRLAELSGSLNASMLENWVLENLLTVLLLTASNHPPDNTEEIPIIKAHQVVRAFRAMIIHNRESIPQMDFFCEQLGISEMSLNYICKISTGKSTKKLLQQLLLENIDKVILNPKYALKDVMMLSGFKNASTFITHFRKMKGYTPDEYRRLFGVKSLKPQSPLK